MINIRPLIETRLRTISDFKEVAGASDLASLLAGRLADYGCYVLQERDAPSENQSVVTVLQKNVEHYACIIVVRNVKTARGKDAADVSFNLKAKVIEALLGWSPDLSADPLELSGGSLVSFVNGFHIYKLGFKTAQFIHQK